MSSAVGKALHIGEHEEQELTEAFDATLANWNVFLFDGFGSFDPDVIYNRIEYLASGLECRIIFLDHLSILLSGLDGDERRMIDSTMTKLRILVERTGITLFLVSHLRRSNSDSNSHEEGGRVSSDNYEALIRSLRSAIASSLWRETNKVKIQTTLQLCEFLKTVTQEK